MKKYLVLSLVAVMALSAVAPALASQDGEKEDNRGRAISELKRELNDERREDRQEDRRNDDQKKSDLVRALKLAPRAFTIVGKLAMVSSLVEFTSTTTSTDITVNVTKVLPGKANKKMIELGLAYPEVGKNVIFKITNRTSLTKAFGGKMKLSEMSVGDEVRLVVKYNKDGSYFVKVLHNNSLQNLRNGKGTVSSFDTANSSFVWKQEKREATVKVSAQTKVVLVKDGVRSNSSFAEIKVGDVVRIDGTLNSNLKTVSPTKSVTIKRTTVVSTPAQ